ncbi:MAG TPA: AMP-binding protein [Burkholderiaceae bacterium]|nr:AMP-binding protein [Burkholderiaceae bacterium]
MTSMPQLRDSPLAAAAAHLDSPAVVGATHTWTWRQIHAASIELSHRLGDASAVCNLCNSRVSFLVTWLAGLRNRCLLILPPSSGDADLAAVLAASSRPVAVTDSSQAGQAAWRDSARGISCQPEWRPSHATARELAWQPAWDDTAVLLHTSGSTGVPVAQPRTLRHLATGALVLGARLEHDIDGGLQSIRRIVCSVPPQHMFGLECSVMLPLVHAIPVLDGRPLLPADVRDAFAASPPAAWVATPLHLRSLVRAGDGVPNCSVVIASTMPLPEALARQTEDLVGAPVLEIYGSTETGAMAMRRSACETQWSPLPDVTLASTAAAGTQVRGSHFASPVTLLDRIDIDPSGRFTLLGRQADLIKIAGRRASIAGLNALLQELPGLEEGVFYLPASDEPTARLCLIHSGPALDRAAMDQWLRARIDPVFLPRTLIRVDRLPRDDNGKLPRHALDRVFAEWLAAARPPATFEFTVPNDHPALPGHFPGRAIVPGVLLLDHVLERLGTALGRPVVMLQQVKFALPLLPGETARVDVSVDDGRRVGFSVTARRDGVAVLLASGSVVLAEPEALP